MSSGLLANPRWQLPEQIIGDQSPPLRVHPRVGPERVQGRERSLADADAVDREQLRDLVVAASPNQHEL